MFRFVRNIRISRRLGIFFQITILPMIILFGMFVFITNSIYELENKIMIDNVATIRAVYNLELSLLRLRRLNANYIIKPDKRYLDAFRSDADEFKKWLRESGKSPGKNEGVILKNIDSNFEKYLNKHVEIVRLIKQDNKTKAIHTMLSEGNNYYDLIYEDCERLIRVNDDRIAVLEEKAMRYLVLSKRIGYATIAVFLMIGIVSYIVISRSILEPIKEIESASGKFTDAKAHTIDELELLKTRFQNMMKTIRKSQSQLVRTEKRAAVGQIAAGISHELNNPIGIISGFAEMLSKSSRLTMKDKNIAHEIYRESQRCRLLLGDFLNFAKTPNPRMRRTDIVKIVSHLIHSCATNDQFSRVDFTFKSERPSMIAYVDPMQIRQVFVNIILNACDAMKNRGKLAVSCAYSKNGMVIAFKDSGPGIDAAVIKKIFDPFFSTKPKGTGLGLAISHDIIDRHEGKIHCSSSQEGTLFSILLTKGIYGNKNA
ncbi:MAG TPA: ATP-binding protein [Spirochaetota bacterium]